MTHRAKRSWHTLWLLPDRCSCGLTWPCPDAEGDERAGGPIPDGIEVGLRGCGIGNHLHEVKPEPRNQPAGSVAGSDLVYPYRALSHSCGRWPS